MARKRSLLRLYLLYLLVFAAVPVAVLGYLWITTDYARFEDQTRDWRDTYVASRQDLLRREVLNAVNYVEFKQAELEQRTRQELTREIRRALTLLQNLHLESTDNDRDAILQRAAKNLAGQRFFSDQGFYYLINNDGKSVLPPILPNTGNRMDLDTPITTIWTQVRRLREQGDRGFFQYRFGRAGGREPYRNISFVYHYRPLDVYVVAGVYEQHVQALIREEVRQRLSQIPTDDRRALVFVTDNDGKGLLERDDNTQWPEVGAWLAASDEPRAMVELQWPLPEGDGNKTAMAFVHQVPEWDWVIGAAYLLDELNALLVQEEEKQQARMWQHIRFILMVAVGLMLVALLVSRRFLGQLGRTFQRFENFFDEAAKKSIHIDMDRVAFQEFANLADHANDMVDERSRNEQALVAARIEAEDANHAKSQFLSSVSHELRTPLNGVLGYTQLLLRDKTLAAGQRQQLNAIDTCARHLLTLINNVLDLAKIESGNMEVDSRSRHLDDVLRSVGDIVRHRAEGKGLAYKVERDSSLPDWLLMDVVKIRQVLVNLLDNAVKFTERGSITLNVFLRDEDVVFEVHDTGMGIPEDKLEEVFEPFRQVNPHEGVGTGLGLSICFRLCEAMGGGLQARSEFGTGTVFWFTIPMRPGEAGEREGGDNQAATATEYRFASPLNILIADDNDTNRRLLTEMLGSVPGECDSVDSGEAAVARVQKQCPDLLLLDMKMPDMDGLAVLRALNQDPAFGSCKTVLITAVLDEALAQEARQLGCEGFLPKPIAWEDLLALCAELFDAEAIAQGEEPDVDALLNASATAVDDVRLPEDCVAAVLEALDMGDIGQARKKLDAALGSDESLAPAVNHATELLDLFDLEGLRTYLSRTEEDHAR